MKKIRSGKKGKSNAFGHQFKKNFYRFVRSLVDGVFDKAQHICCRFSCRAIGPDYIDKGKTVDL
jgi:hypothetical protein